MEKNLSWRVEKFKNRRKREQGQKEPVEARRKVTEAGCAGLETPEKRL